MECCVVQRFKATTRILALALSLILVFALIPVPTFAASEDNDPVSREKLDVIVNELISGLYADVEALASGLVTPAVEGLIGSSDAIKTLITPILKETVSALLAQALPGVDFSQIADIDALVDEVLASDFVDEALSTLLQSDFFTLTMKYAIEDALGQAGLSELKNQAIATSADTIWNAPTRLVGNAKIPVKYIGVFTDTKIFGVWLNTSFYDFDVTKWSSGFTQKIEEINLKGWHRANINTYLTGTTMVSIIASIPSITSNIQGLDFQTIVLNAALRAGKEILTQKLTQLKTLVYDWITAELAKLDIHVTLDPTAGLEQLWPALQAGLIDKLDRDVASAKAQLCEEIEACFAQHGLTISLDPNQSLPAIMASLQAQIEEILREYGEQTKEKIEQAMAELCQKLQAFKAETFARFNELFSRLGLELGLTPANDWCDILPAIKTAVKAKIEQCAADKREALEAALERLMSWVDCTLGALCTELDAFIKGDLQDILNRINGYFKIRLEGVGEDGLIMEAGSYIVVPPAEFNPYTNDCVFDFTVTSQANGLQMLFTRADVRCFKGNWALVVPAMPEQTTELTITAYVTVKDCRVQIAQRKFTLVAEEKLAPMTVETQVILVDLPANLNLTIDPALMPAGPVYAYFADTHGVLDLSSKTLIDANGKCRMRLPLAPSEPGACQILAFEGDAAKPFAACAIQLEKVDDLWAPKIVDEGGLIKILFADDVQIKAGGKATINDVQVSFSYGADGRSIVLNSAYSTRPVGGSIKISGLKYPRILPSYSFTFTIPVV